jgi:hypothetical protein
MRSRPIGRGGKRTEKTTEIFLKVVAVHTGGAIATFGQWVSFNF